MRFFTNLIKDNEAEIFINIMKISNCKLDISKLLNKTLKYRSHAIYWYLVKNYQFEPKDINVLKCVRIIESSNNNCKKIGIDMIKRLKPYVNDEITDVVWKMNSANARRIVWKILDVINCEKK